MNHPRAWLAWLFLIATTVAQGPHRHDRPGPLFAEEFGSCAEAGRHWAGHEAVADDGGADACPLCQLRSQPMLAEPAPVLDRPAVTSAWLDAGSPRDGAGLSLRIRCRAPPEA